MNRSGLYFASLVTLVTAATALAQAPVGTAFSYQGRLSRSDPIFQATTYDLRFSLWDAATDGSQIGPMLEFPQVDMQPGNIFTVLLDFEVSVFDGQARWLRVDVKETADTLYIILSPRQPITPAPYALHALNAGQWQSNGSAIMNTNTGFVGINRTNTVGLEWFGVHAPVNSGYGGMYITTEGATAWPFYGYKAGTSSAWTYLDGGDGDWHVNVGGNKLTVSNEGMVGIRTTDPAYPLHVVSTNTDRTIHGENSTMTGVGVRGRAAHATGLNFGVYGETASSSGTAVFGTATAASGLTVGGRFNSDSASGTGVDAGGGFIGVAATAWSSTGDTWGGLFQNQSSGGAGVRGLSNHASGTGKGVWGSSSSTSGVGVHGQALAATGSARAVWGEVTSASAYAGYFSGGRNYFQGNVGCGTLTPANPLSVAGDADITGRVSIGITGADARLLVRGIVGEDAFRVRVDTATKLLVKDNGGVGIGSNFPAVPANGLRTAGAVGIGADPGAFTLVSNGDAAKPGGGSWSNFSDARLKRDIEPMAPGMLDRVLSLRGHTFEYVDKAVEKRLGLPGRQMGLIAQEVQAVFPEWVDADDEGYLYVTERSQTAIMVEALRELRAEKDAAIASLHSENEELRQRLTRLESTMARLAGK